MSAGSTHGVFVKAAVVRQKTFFAEANKLKKQGLKDEEIDFVFTEGVSIDEKKVRPRFGVDQNSASK